jgi:hypothetical protein
MRRIDRKKYAVASTNSKEKEQGCNKVGEKKGTQLSLRLSGFTGNMVSYLRACR